MGLSAGTRIGAYEIVSAIGSGGMGEVYRARDTTLNRDVAIKILPEALAADPDRLARFKREAQVLASLNHPNIAGIYGIEERAIVMELVEGRDLSQMIGALDNQGALRTPGIPLADALPIARQIAGALEAAHEQGIIHRDLKPQNIKVRGDGTVKVLDFGLAKMMGADPGAAEATPYVPSESPTMLSPARTEMGLIIGTAAYMSPEQAKGRAVDKRADIWAFGVVLYEMLTGRALFAGDSVAETIGFVATRDPDWTALPAATPAGVRRLLARCLTRDPKHRLRDIGEARVALATSDAIGSAADVPAPDADRLRRRERRFWIAGVVAAAAIAGFAVWLLRPAKSTVPNVVTRFTVPLPEGQALGSWIAMSPDGRLLAYTADRQLYLRAMDQMEAQPVRGSEENPSRIVFSPDGQWIAYLAQLRTKAGTATALKRIPVTGGSPVTIFEGIEQVTRLSWRGDTIYFARDNRPGSPGAVYAIAASGGEPRAIVTLDSDKESVDDPQLLADGRHMLITYAGADFISSVAIQSLETGTRTVLVKSAYDARILPTGDLVYRVSRRMFVVPFDSKRLELRGNPVTLIEGVRGYDVSDTGTMVFIPGPLEDAPQLNTLVWVDREGRETPLPAKARAYAHPRISPDGTRIVVDSRDEESDLWVWGIERETLSRLTFGKDVIEGYPIWTRDGRDVIYRAGSELGADIFRRRADGTGTAEALTKGAPLASPHSLTADGRQLVYRDSTDKTSRDLFVLPLDPPRAPKPLVQSAFDEENGEVSPDGRWIAYESNESSARNIYLRPFPAVDDGKWQISSGGGWSPMWSRDSRELFYRSAREFLVADVPAGLAGAAFTSSKPRALFPFAGYLFASTRTYDISPDGRRFLMVKTGTVQQGPATKLMIVSNWFDELRARVTGK